MNQGVIGQYVGMLQQFYISGQAEGMGIPRRYAAVRCDSEMQKHIPGEVGKTVFFKCGLELFPCHVTLMNLNRVFVAAREEGEARPIGICLPTFFQRIQ